MRLCRANCRATLINRPHNGVQRGPNIMRVASILKIAAAALALGTVSACAAPGFRAEVSRFQQMPAPQGQSFFVVAQDEGNAGGLEFAHYASLVADQLARVGYRPAATADGADFIVKLGYGVDQGRERIVREPGFVDPFWGPGWGGHGYYGRGYFGRGFYGPPAIIRTPGGYRYVHGLYDPFLFGPSFGDYGDVARYTVYTSGVNVLIEQRDGGQHLFEGSAEAASRTNELPALVPNLVEALFTDFPGNSGEKVRITIAPPEGGRR